MTWAIDTLRNPVLMWELKRAARRRLWAGLLLAYSAWLILHVLILFPATPKWDLPDELRERLQRRARLADPNDRRYRLELYRLVRAQQTEFVADYLGGVLKIQLLVILAIVPALTAGSLGQEKERGTLFALFGTQLSSQQILLGKLLGRLFLIVPLLLTALPPLLFVTTIIERSPTTIFVALGQEAVLAVVLGAFCLLIAIWVHRASDAIIASYLVLGIGYLLIRNLTGLAPLADLLDPATNLQNLLAHGSLLPFVTHLALWASGGLLCLALAWEHLRKVCLENRDKTPRRRIWAYRPAVGENPIRWRECHVIGLAPMPILRRVPRWTAVLVVFASSILFAAIIAESHASGLMKQLVGSNAGRDEDARTRAVRDAVPTMGLTFILLATSVIGVRCGISVGEEKRQNTWDDLLLTAQSFREITTGKMWGILQATVPYVIAFAIPILFVAAMGGPIALFSAAVWLILPCVVVLTAARKGIDMLRIPPDMDETRRGGAFWFENEQSSKYVDGWGSF
jgi:ABC-type transport system involved in multi-copper enzyme maturation permease subunit